MGVAPQSLSPRPCPARAVLASCRICALVPDACSVCVYVEASLPGRALQTPLTWADFSDRLQQDARKGHVCHGSWRDISKLRLEQGHGAHWSDAPIGASSKGSMEHRLITGTWH